jgi:hypothetical protein
MRRAPLALRITTASDFTREPAKSDQLQKAAVSAATCGIPLRYARLMTSSLVSADLPTVHLQLRDTREALGAFLQDEDAKARVMRAASGALRVRRDSLVARELIADVVGDLFSGELAWEPTTSREQWALAMASHVIGELRRRAIRSHRATRHLVPLAILQVADIVCHVARSGFVDSPTNATTFTMASRRWARRVLRPPRPRCARPGGHGGSRHRRRSASARA